MTLYSPQRLLTPSSAERDIPYCGGDCLATGDPALPSIPAASKPYFPNAAVFEAFIVPGAGHGLNLVSHCGVHDHGEMNVDGPLRSTRTPRRTAPS